MWPMSATPTQIFVPYPRPSVSCRFREESNQMESVQFITCEDDGTDQVISFALACGEMEITSLTLLRTPEFERILDEAERGVSVSLEAETDEDFDMLEVVMLEANSVTIKTQETKYDLDVSRVDPDELSEMKVLMERMNFDAGFRIENV